MINLFHIRLLFVIIGIIRNYYYYKLTKNIISFYFIILLIMSMIIETFTDAYIIYSLKKFNSINLEDRLINDVFFDLITFLLKFIPSMYNYICTPVLFLALGMIGFSFKNQKYFDTAILNITIMFFLRDFSTLLTNLPLTKYDIHDGRCLEYSRLSFIEIWKKHTIHGFECGDYFFSGHTSFFTFGLINLNTFFKKYIYIGYIIWIIGILGLLISNAHYSIDILYGTLMAIIINYYVSNYIIKWYFKMIYKK